ncbi:hypothetical protein ACFQ3S_13825 [Mucilaginibacter terrae]|uniref:restriction system modified-DNA reader domain-containing protein n=1 Tax=Mucilaginibacter terrae TaxID=1955052 RepID=UPI00364204DE
MKYQEQQDVTLEMLIQAGIIQAGTTLFAASDSNITGTLNANGSITLMIDGKEKLFPYPSGAARAIRNVSVSGWTFWRIKKDQEFVELLKIKQRYLEQSTK